MNNPFTHFIPPGPRRSFGPTPGYDPSVFQDPFIAAASGIHQPQFQNRGIRPQHQHQQQHYHHHHHNCSMGACCSKPPAPPPKTYLYDPYAGFYGGAGRPLPSGLRPGSAGAATAESTATTAAPSVASAAESSENPRPGFVPGMAPPKSPGRNVRFNIPDSDASAYPGIHHHFHHHHPHGDLGFIPNDPFPPRSPGAGPSGPQYAPDLGFEPLDPFPPRSQPGAAKKAAGSGTGTVPGAPAGPAARAGPFTIDRDGALRARLEHMTSTDAPYADARTLEFVKQLCAKPETRAVVVEVFKSQITLGGIQANKALRFLPALPVPAIAQFVGELNKFLKEVDEWHAEAAAALRDHAIAAQAAVENKDEANFPAYLAALGRGARAPRPYQGVPFRGQAPRHAMMHVPGAYPLPPPWQ